MPPEKNENEVSDVFAGGEPDDLEVEGDRGDDHVNPEDEPIEGEVVDAGVEEGTDGEEAEAEEGEEASGEAEEAPEGKAAEDEDGEPEPEPEPEPKKQHRIPKERFDQVNDRRKIAEEQNLQLQERIKQLEADGGEGGEDAFDFASKEQEYAEAIVDGEFEKAKTIRAEIRTADRAEMRKEMQATEQNATNRTKDQLAFDNTVNEYRGKFAEFDPESESYDDALTAEVVEMRDGYMASGNYSPAEALAKAAKTIAKVYDLSDQTAEPVVDDEVVVEPKKTNVKEKAKTAGKQPPKMDTGTPSGEAAVSVLDMNEDEFDALPESAKARLRGDIM